MHGFGGGVDGVGGCVCVVVVVFDQANKRIRESLRVGSESKILLALQN
jgi:hypothetical protein